MSELQRDESKVELTASVFPANAISFNFFMWSKAVMLKCSRKEHRAHRNDRHHCRRCDSNRCFLVPFFRELMALVRANWNLEFLLYSRLVFRSSSGVYDNEAFWWCPSSFTPLTGGSVAQLALWIRTLNARGSSTSQSRQTRPGAELSGPV